METIASRRSVLKQTPTRPGSLPGNGSAVELCYLWGWGPKVSVESKNLIWSKIHLEIPEGATLRPLRSKSQELASFVAFLFVTEVQALLRQVTWREGNSQKRQTIKELSIAAASSGAGAGVNKASSGHSLTVPLGKQDPRGLWGNVGRGDLKNLEGKVWYIQFIDHCVWECPFLSLPGEQRSSHCGQTSQPCSRV